MQETYYFSGYGGIPSKCHLEIHDNVVIATELSDNPGTSITNMAEVLATRVCADHLIAPELLIWVEHYPHLMQSRPEEYWDLVTFGSLSPLGVFSGPTWKRITPGEVELLKVIRSWPL